MLNADNALLLVIDIQGKLATLMHDRESLFENTKKLIRGAKVLGLPILVTEQYPKGLGPTVPEIAELIENAPIAKTAFSCCGDTEFVKALEAAGRPHVLICGIEAHVCVYQTATDLLRRGFHVHVVTDAVSSRAAHNRDLAIGKMNDKGAELTSVEMALFEMLRVAEGEKFKQIAKIVR